MPSSVTAIDQQVRRCSPKTRTELWLRVVCHATTSHTRLMGCVCVCVCGGGPRQRQNVCMCVVVRACAHVCVCVCVRACVRTRSLHFCRGCYCLPIKKRYKRLRRGLHFTQYCPSVDDTRRGCHWNWSNKKKTNHVSCACRFHTSQSIV